MLMVNQLTGFVSPRRNIGPIQFVGGQAAGVQASLSTSSLTLSSGLTGGTRAFVRPGDFIIAAQLVSGDNPSRAAGITDGTTNYTQIVSLSSDRALLLVSYKFATSNDTSTIFKESHSVDEGSATCVYVFSGVDTFNPFDTATTTASQTSASLANPPSITPVTPGAYIVCIGGTAHQLSGTDLFTSSDLTDFLTAGNAELLSDATIGVGHKPDWVSGAFNAAAFGFTPQGNSTNDDWHAVSIALRPA